LYAQSLQLPELSFKEEKIEGASMVYWVASAAKWNKVVVKFYDLHGLHEIFKDWQDLIWNPKDGIKEATGYKGEPKFVLIDGKGEKKQTYTLIGAYPSNVTHGELSYERSEIKILEVTYTFDFAMREFPGS
jgi:hypothetical protein